MQFINILIMIFLMTVVSGQTVSANRQIIDYSDNKRGNPGYVQPVYFMYYEFDKCRLKYGSEYDIRRKFFADDLRTPIAIDPEKQILPLYLRAKHDMHPSGSPDNYYLFKDNLLRINFEVDKNIIKDMIVVFKIPEQFYFTISPDVIQIDTQKQTTISVQDIQLQELEFDKFRAIKLMMK